MPVQNLTRRPLFLLAALVAIAGLVATLLLSSSVAGAETTTLTPSADNTIFAGAVNNSGGGDDNFFAGRAGTRGGGGAAQRALLSFDVASVVPAGSTVTDVTLTLHVTKAASAPGSAALHRLNVAWGEGADVSTRGGGIGAPASTGAATWSAPFHPSPGWTPGGDFVAAASASSATGANGSIVSLTGAGLVADVQAWVDGGTANNGWVVMGNESTDSTSRRFASRENGNAALHPTLEIEFTAGPPTVACGGANHVVTVDTTVGQQPTTGNDVILVAGGTVDGLAGDDIIVGSEADETLLGGPGEDLICGLGGNDTLDGGPGSDRIFGGDGGDTVTGG